MLQPCVFQIFVVPLQAEKETNKTMRHKISVILGMAVLFAACGVKKPMVVQDEKDEFALKGQIIESNADTFEAPSVLGLLWEKDTLFVTLNNGHQLGQAKIVSDTLILHEASRDTTDNATRRYAIHIPMREMLVIKYNDTLTYPVMPTAVLCEYPLDIKAVEPTRDQLISASEKTAKKDRYFPSNAHASFPDLDVDGICGMYYNGDIIESSLGKMQTDSTMQLYIFPDGSWYKYQKNTLLNCGIIRRTKRTQGYKMLIGKAYAVFLSDTTQISKHVHPVGDLWQHLRDGGSAPDGEYYFYESGDVSVFTYYSVFSLTNNPQQFIVSEWGDLVYEGKPYGWSKHKRH